MMDFATFCRDYLLIVFLCPLLKRNWYPPLFCFCDSQYFVSFTHHCRIYDPLIARNKHSLAFFILGSIEQSLKAGLDAHRVEKMSLCNRAKCRSLERQPISKVKGQRDEAYEPYVLS